MSSSNTGSLEQMSKKITHDNCGTVDCCGLCDTATIVVGDTPPMNVQKQSEKTYEQVHKAMVETSQSRDTE